MKSEWDYAEESDQLPQIKKQGKKAADKEPSTHNELIAKRNNKMEAEVKKYNKIINMTKNKDKDGLPAPLGGNSSVIGASPSKPSLDFLLGDQSKISAAKKDFMKIYGVKLVNQGNSLPPKNSQNRSKIVSKSSNPNLPKIEKAGSSNKLQKYEKLPKILAA